MEEIYGSCPVKLGPWIMAADSLVWWQLQDFDRVLTMDRLAWYHATMDCGERTVTFPQAGQEELSTEVAVVPFL